MKKEPHDVAPIRCLAFPPKPSRGRTALAPRAGASTDVSTRHSTVGVRRRRRWGEADLGTVPILKHPSETSQMAAMAHISFAYPQVSWIRVTKYPQPVSIQVSAKCGLFLSKGLWPMAVFAHLNAEENKQTNKQKTCRTHSANWAFQHIHPYTIYKPLRSRVLLLGNLSILRMCCPCAPPPHEPRRSG